MEMKERVQIINDMSPVTGQAEYQVVFHVLFFTCQINTAVHTLEMVH